MPSQEIVQTEENILVFDNIFSRGYGFSPQVLTRIPQLSIEAKGLYSYFSSFAGQGGVAFPSTSTILAEMNISKNRFYKYRSELEAWGFITVDIENTRHGNLNVAIKNGVACFSQAEAGVPLIASHPADFLALLVSATFTVLLIIVAVNSYRRFAGSEEVRNLDVEQAKTQLQLYRCEKKLEKLIEEQQKGSEDDR